MTKDEISYVVNILRKGTMTWRGRTQALNAARICKVEGVRANGKIRKKYYWKCCKCSQEFRDQSCVEVDHIIEIGPFKGDWNEFIARMYCGQENLQVLCVVCHAKKTSGYNASRKYTRKG